MTATTEFGEILDRFREALKETEEWGGRMFPGQDLPSWFGQLTSVYSALCCKWLTMKNAEQLLETAVKPTRPLPEPPPRAHSATEQNAEEIGKLQGQLAELAGQVDFLFGSHLKLRRTAIEIQDREMARMQDRIDASKKNVPE